MCTAAGRVPDSAIRQFPVTVRAQIALQTGSGEALAVIQDEAMSAEGGDGILAEQGTLRAVAALQAGRVPEAVSALEAVFATTTAKGPRAAAGAALALAYDTCGRAADAVRVCDDISENAVTYLDHLQIALARGFALVQLGDPAGAEQAFWRALEIADQSDSVLDQAVSRLARQIAWEAMGRSDVDWARDEARSALAAVGVDAPGWDTTFRLSAGIR
jgi:tetratricopeptide (TPR) repeat protein